MKTSTKVVIILVVIGLVIGGFVIFSTNSLASAENKVEQKAADIDTQLQRRIDLIPNLISTVQAFTDHETEIFEELSNARAAMMSAGNMEEKAEANDQLSAGLSRLIAVAEAYPELTSSTLYTNLMDELAGTENRIAYSREEYNSAVSNFNRLLRVFPTSLFAGGYDKAVYFKASEGASEVPVVEFK